MEQKQISGLLGAALLFVGIFAPIFGSPLKGAVNYFQFSRFEASVVLGCAALALTLATARRYEFLWMAGLGAFGAMGFTFIKFILITSGSGSRFAEGFFDSPFEGINQLVRRTFALEWGWAALLAGAVLVMAAANLKGTAPPPTPGNAEHSSRTGKTQNPRN